jgi:hypothetical protein
MRDSKQSLPIVAHQPPYGEVEEDMWTTID